jgi:protein CWC15
LEERESHGAIKDRSASSSVLSKRSRHEDESNADVDDPLDEDVGDLSDSDDDSDDEADLMAELAAIKKERAAERAEKEARENAEKV